MLLSQGDFIETLMHNVSIELNKPAKVLYRHNLLNHLETSIRSTSICDESIEILSKIDINISNDHEIGWDCFQLTYNFTSPLNSVFDDMSIYDKMFTILWKLKRVRYCVSECWNGNVDGLILFEMIHFIDQILYYFNMVVEGCWMVFSNLVDNSHDFQEMITIHENFLVELSKKGMVSNQHDVIMKRLDCVFECIIGFKNVDGDGLDLFGKKFRALVVGFLKVLAIDSDQELRELGQRINFNDFYSF